MDACGHILELPRRRRKLQQGWLGSCARHMDLSLCATGHVTAQQ
ncbi:hypothetical protein F441_02583 [Phytophthora nicotianae CJ01A1]|uniref:Uncharacterized protein n=1 Tax=Phytophthora nicotianae CJ01A1 TaxID=1317063 RepID=W2XR25_PHYNI|nr:hypothetical protein F441_02583 [Phytophthora nicotianae CJ01A1]